MTNAPFNPKRHIDSLSLLCGIIKCTDNCVSQEADNDWGQQALLQICQEVRGRRSYLVRLEVGRVGLKEDSSAPEDEDAIKSFAASKYTGGVDISVFKAATSFFLATSMFPHV